MTNSIRGTCVAHPRCGFLYCNFQAYVLFSENKRMNYSQLEVWWNQARVSRCHLMQVCFVEEILFLLPNMCSSISGCWNTSGGDHGKDYLGCLDWLSHSRRVSVWWHQLVLWLQMIDQISHETRPFFLWIDLISLKHLPWIVLWGKWSFNLIRRITFPQ